MDGVVRDGLWDPYSNIHMGSCAELCAERYGIGRKQQVGLGKRGCSRTIDQKAAVLLGGWVDRKDLGRAVYGRGCSVSSMPDVTTFPLKHIGPSLLDFTATLPGSSNTTVYPRMPCTYRTSTRKPATNAPPRRRRLATPRPRSFPCRDPAVAAAAARAFRRLRRSTAAAAAGHPSGRPAARRPPLAAAARLRRYCRWWRRRRRRRRRPRPGRPPPQGATFGRWAVRLFVAHGKREVS